MRVNELMTKNPATLEVDATVRDAVRILAELDVRHLPIMEDKALVGIVSDRDLREMLGIESGETRRAKLDTAVSEIMSADVQIVGPEDEVGDVIDLMIEQKLGAVPVVDRGSLVGVVSYVDILREARELF